MSKNSSSTHQNRTSEQQEEELYGVTDQLIEHVKSFTVGTFMSSPSQGLSAYLRFETLQRDLNNQLSKDRSEEAPTTTGDVRKDLSEWQQRHATIVLCKFKEVSMLRYTLCPCHLKERQFWRMYFTLVRSLVTEYVLRAIQHKKLKTMAMGDEKASGNEVIELEMSEAKPTSILLPSAHD